MESSDWQFCKFLPSLKIANERRLIKYRASAANFIRLAGLSTLKDSADPLCKFCSLESLFSKSIH